MTSRVTSHLSLPLMSVLRSGCPAVLLTLGGDGFPAGAYTWALALDPTTVRFAVDHGSTALANLERETRASLQIAQEGLTVLIKGTSSQVKPLLEATGDLGVALWALHVTEVKDQSWPGVRVQPLAYEWAPPHKAQMIEMERRVYSEMREWRG